MAANRTEPTREVNCVTRSPLLPPPPPPPAPPVDAGASQVVALAVASHCLGTGGAAASGEATGEAAAEGKAVTSE